MQWIGCGPFICGHVRNLKKVALKDRMCANGMIQRRFDGVKSDTGLEPLPVIIDQTDQRHRNVTNLRRQSDDIIKIRFSIRVENIVGFKCLDAFVLVGVAIG